MNKILTLGTIRDYIIQWFPELKFWDGFHQHEFYRDDRNFKHRQGMPNEIRIEFDSDDLNKNWIDTNNTCINLNKRGYSFAVFYVEGGRSPHIHIYDLDELESLNEEQRNEYRRLFLNLVCPKDSKVDYALCDEKHLCALEFVNHFKYGKPKQLINYFWNGRNMGIEFDLKLKILNKKKKKSAEIYYGNNKKLGVFTNKLTFEKVFDKYNVKYKGKMAQCPFHLDTNNSLSFSNEKFLWNCFGCNEKGDILTLIKKLEGLRDDFKTRSE